MPRIAAPGKDGNSKREVQFLLEAYRFRTAIKSKNWKLNHCKLGPSALKKLWLCSSYRFCTIPTVQGHVHGSLSGSLNRELEVKKVILTPSKQLL